MANYEKVTEGYGELLLRWTLTNADNTGQEFYVPPVYQNNLVQVEGTFGGATVYLDGNVSLESSNWGHLRNYWGVPIAFTAAGKEVVTEIPRYIRPVLSGGSGSFVTVYLLLRM